MQYIKFTSKADFEAWDRAEFLELCDNQPQELVVVDASAKYGKYIKGYKRSQINHNSGFTYDYSDFIENPNNSTILTDSLCFNEDHVSQDYLSIYNATTISYEEAVSEGFFNDDII